MKRLWLLVVLAPWFGCAREALLVRLVDAPLARGELNEAVRGYEGVGAREDARLKQLAEEVLRVAMRADDVAVRRRATALVVQLADPALDVDLPPRLGDTDDEVRVSAAVALAWQSEIAQQAVIDFLASREPRLRLLALDGLAKIPDGKARLLTAIHDADAGVRARAANLIGPWKNHAAITALGELLDDKDLGVRLTAIHVLGGLERADDVPRWLKLVEDPSLPIQLAAVTAMGRFARHHDGPKRLLALRSGPMVLVRTAAPLFALGLADEALARIRAALADGHPEVRQAALNAASELGPGGIALATAACNDPDENVRLAAARVALAETSLQKPVFSPCVAALRAMANGPRAFDAAFELARRGDELGRHILYDALDTDTADAANTSDASADRRATALRSLAPLRGNLPLLTHALRDPRPEIRLFAAETLLRRAFH